MRTAGMFVGLGSVQLRHSRHVSTTVSTVSFIVAGKPAARKIVFIASFVACHHRKCSFRTSRKRTAALKDRSSRNDCDTSNLDQSETCSPAPASAILGPAARSTAAEGSSSSCTAGGAGGAGASSSPARITPRGSPLPDEGWLPEAAPGAGSLDDLAPDPDAAAGVTSSISTSSFKSLPSTSCAWRSAAGELRTRFPGALGWLPVRILVEVWWNLHSPISMVWSPDRKGLRA